MKRVNFVSLDSLTLQWFCNTLQTQHPQTQAAKELYEALNTSRDEIVLDDRKGRAGPKFKDADLIGYPVRVTIGKKLKENGTVEIKIRRTGEVIEVPFAEAAEKVNSVLNSLRAENL